MVMFLDSSWI